MRKVNRGRVGSLALLAGMLLPVLLTAKSRALFYYVPAEDAWQSLEANVRKISILAPQVFIVDREGTVRGTVEERVRRLAAQYQIPLMPLLINESFSPEAAHHVLSDEQVRRRVIADSLRLCLENGCSGLQLDFEGVLLEDGKYYTQFVREAAQAFHARGLQFSVAIGSGLFAGSLPPENYAVLFGGFPVYPVPYEPAELARHVDFISLMTYDHYAKGTAPGPVAGYAWVEQSIRFLLRSVPPEKLSMGLGFYARRWCNQEVSDGNYRETKLLAGRTHAPLRWHPWHRTPWFEFQEAGCRNIVWFENRRSLREKLKLVGRYRLLGFSAWRLGQEDPAFWRELPERRIPNRGR